MRKATPKKRVVLPDPVFNEVKVTKFVNHLMYDGKKSIAFDIFYGALEVVKTKLPNEEKSALEIRAVSDGEKLTVKRQRQSGYRINECLLGFSDNLLHFNL